MSIILNGVSKSFEGTKRETLSDISLNIEDGEFICVVGPSGCGKSTMLNLIAGLDTPTSGTISVDGRKVTGPGADRVVMFQEAALYPWLSVIQNVRLGMRFIGIGSDEQERRAEHYLRMVHLWDFRDYAVHEISGGMKQRTSLARSLCMESKILLMDEPFSALDKQTTNKLREELTSIWSETGKTIFFITHSIEEAVYLADRIIVLSDNPGTIKKVIENDLPRPRHIEDADFISLRKNLLGYVRKEVDKVEKDEYDAE